MHTRHPGIDEATISVVHLIIRRDVEPVLPEPDTVRHIRTPAHIIQPDGCEVIVDEIDYQILIRFIRVQVELVKDRVAPDFFRGEGRIER